MRIYFAILFVLLGVLSIVIAAVMYPNGTKLVRRSRALPLTAALAFFASAGFVSFGALESTIGIVLSAAFSFTGLILLLEFCLWKIEYSDAQMMVRGLFRKRIIDIDDVIGLGGRDMSGMLYFKDGSKLRIDDLNVGSEELLKAVKRRLRKLGKPAPPKISEKLFGGRVHSAGEFVFIFVMLGLFFGIMSCLILSETLQDVNVKEENCTTILSEHWTITKDEEALAFYYPGEQRPYRLFTDDLEEDDLLNRLRSAKSICLWIRSKDLNDSDRKGFVVRQLSADGMLLVSIDAVNHSYSDNLWDSLVFVFLIDALYAAFVISFCYFVSRAEQYPRIARFFVREEYLNLPSSRKKEPPAFQNRVGKVSKKCSPETFYLMNVAQFRQEQDAESDREADDEI